MMSSVRILPQVRSWRKVQLGHGHNSNPGFLFKGHIPIAIAADSVGSAAGPRMSHLQSAGRQESIDKVWLGCLIRASTLFGLFRPGSCLTTRDPFAAPFAGARYLASQAFTRPLVATSVVIPATTETSITARQMTNSTGFSGLDHGIFKFLGWERLDFVDVEKSHANDPLKLRNRKPVDLDTRFMPHSVIPVAIPFSFVHMQAPTPRGARRSSAAPSPPSAPW